MALEAELARQFEHEFDSLQQLKDILAREHRALLDSDVAAIEALSAEKSALLTRQGELGHARQQLLRSAGLGDAPADVSAFVHGSPDRAALAAVYARIAALVQQCRDDNRSNGRLIAQQQRRAQGALDVLRGAQSPGSATYSSSGSHKRDGNSSRTLGRA